MTVVLGIDVGKNLGWAVLDFDTGDIVDADTEVIKPDRPRSKVEADVLAEWEAKYLTATADAVAELVRTWTPIGTGIEAPFVHAKHITGSTTLLKQHGAIQLRLWGHSIAPAAYSTGTVKKYATTRGGADKSAMRLAAVRRWGERAFALGPDAVDAAWVADLHRVRTHEMWEGA